MKEIVRPESYFASVIIEELEHAAAGFSPANYIDRDEPFVGYVLASNDKVNTVERLLVCRHYTPLNFDPKNPLTQYVSYLAPLGQIMAKQPGDSHEYVVRHAKTKFIFGRFCYKLLEKASFTPKRGIDSLWDAVDCRFDKCDISTLIKSLRGLIGGSQDSPHQREFRYSVQLPSQAILDRVQDEIFRLPLNHYVRISGAPGTGKTTVLLKRLSQKMKPAFLTDDEKGLVDDNDDHQWILFAPSDLLKSYLKEALAKERLPASDANVKVFSTFRLEMLRDMAFVRVGTRGYFKPSPEGTSLLENSSSKAHLSLSRDFSAFLQVVRARTAGDAMRELRDTMRISLGTLTDASNHFLKKALEIMMEAVPSEDSRIDAKERARDYNEHSAKINEIVAKVRKVESMEFDSLDYSTPISADTRSKEIADIANEISSTYEGFALLPEVSQQLIVIQKTLRKLSDALSVNNMFRLIPRAYDEFRLLSSTQVKHFDEARAREIKERFISDPELDVLLLHALEYIRLVPSPLISTGGNIGDDLKVLLKQLRPMVMIDEATDFSPLEIACMERFARPKKGGVTISGDLMQRVTEVGLRTWDDISSLCHQYESKELTTGYRQTHRLFSIAIDLCEHVTKAQTNFRSAYESRDEDPPALLFKSTDSDPVEKWISSRICEIFELSNNHLPTTAVLVPCPEDVDPLYSKLLPLLRENGLQLDASESGHTLGDVARVRIFPVEHIKGLEFEAVLYVGLDRMAEIHKDLLDKYVYVGLSRARSFLGASYERQFPQRLKCIEHHFLHMGTWESSQQQGSIVSRRVF